jgi:hypothetical protein
MDRGEEIDGEYELGTASHIAYGELGHLRSIRHDDSPFVERPSFARTLCAIAASCVRHPRFDYVRLDDPGLFLSGLRETLRSGVTASRNFQSEPSDRTERPAVDETIR